MDGSFNIEWGLSHHPQIKRQYFQLLGEHAHRLRHILLYLVHWSQIFVLFNHATDMPCTSVHQRNDKWSVLRSWSSGSGSNNGAADRTGVWSEYENTTKENGELTGNGRFVWGCTEIWILTYLCWYYLHPSSLCIHLIQFRVSGLSGLPPWSGCLSITGLHRNTR